MSTILQHHALSHWCAQVTCIVVYVCFHRYVIDEDAGCRVEHNRPVNTGIVEEIKFVLLENLRTAVTVTRNHVIKA